MKLTTSIIARRDGTVRVQGDNGTTFVFERDAGGDLVCDVTDQDTVANLIAGRLFWPANAEDYDSAAAIASGESDDEGDEAPGGDATAPAAAALPLEANTPPVVRRKPGPKPKKA